MAGMQIVCVHAVGEQALGMKCAVEAYPKECSGVSSLSGDSEARREQWIKFAARPERYLCSASESRRIYARPRSARRGR